MRFYRCVSIQSFNLSPFVWDVAWRAFIRHQWLNVTDVVQVALGFCGPAGTALGE
jgi:hypothetical protein